MKTADRADSVTGPEVSSERITSRNGPEGASQCTNFVWEKSKTLKKIYRALSSNQVLIKMKPYPVFLSADASFSEGNLALLPESRNNCS